MYDPIKDTAAQPRYRGRFAPTPSGPLHLGSLFTALAGWLDARAHQGHWMIRMDDLDRQRCPPGADTLILKQLEAHGLFWDEAPRYQSHHAGEYRSALEALQQSGRLYPCACTRTELKQESTEGPDGPVYSGICQPGPRASARPLALRFRVSGQSAALQDRWQGPQLRDVTQAIGDFIVARSDGLVGYQLACVVDEAAQTITDIVRGMDLMGSSLRQQLLQQALGLPHPRYGHLPVLGDATGRKLSKQNHAPGLEATQAAHNLWRCLNLLNLSPPAELQHESPALILGWAKKHWTPEMLPAATFLKVEE